MSFVGGHTLALCVALLLLSQQQFVSSFSPAQTSSVKRSFNPLKPLVSHEVVNKYETRLHALQGFPNTTEQDKPIVTKLEAFAVPAEDVPLSAPVEETPAPPSYIEQSTSFFGDEYRRGLLICVLITIVFSSNSPAVHTAFGALETPPPALLVNAACSCIALGGIALGGPLLDAVTPPPSSFERNQEKSTIEDEDPSAAIKAGLELGVWKGLGMTANVFGLSMTTSNHAAFLIQLTTLLVPVVQGFMGYPISKRIWTSVGLALTGVFLFTQEATVTGTASNMALGDALCLLAALFYAGYDIRCFEWGKQVSARPLITNKIATQALLSILLLLGAGWNEASEFFTSFSSTFSTTLANDPGSLLLLGGVLLWSGLTVNSLAPFVQVGAQQAVGPTKAQTIYASQPMWAALLGFLFLGETVGLQGFIGAGAFVSALVLAATAEADPATLVDDEEER